MTVLDMPVRRPALPPAPVPRVEFCGIDTAVERVPFTIGRDGDLVLDDDNRYLHRQFLVVDMHDGLWTIANVGTQLSANVSDVAGRVAVQLAPSGVMVLSSSASIVRCSAGPTTYEFTVHVPIAPLAQHRHLAADDDFDATVGRVSLSPEQLLLVVVLAEPALRSGHLVAAALPSNTEAAGRLDWTITKFNRKLDAVCTKLADRGVRGLRGGPDRLASHRRSRLVEFAVGSQLVTSSDLSLLDRL